MLAEYRITLPPQTIENANPAAKAVLEKAFAQVGFIPNMYARMVHSPGLLDTYLHGYAAFRGQSGFSTQEGELILLAISRENGCEYCVSAHSFLGDKKSGVPTEVTDAVRNDTEIPDPKLRALATFTRALVAKRGLVSRADVEAFLGAGYEERHILEIILAISVKTLSNYVNHLFHTPLDAVFAPRRWTEAR
ncbi:MAG TPA: alkylhydroperoxidase [Rhodocyclaceae bacterium]|nr:MAG: alkylhydroperoxidase [Betaproteobacteria bacterium CG2_30_68_42]PIV76509.1 MAG: alkylhydroperoxidase [Rhodocyclales bacterium CG17_big_fil_post_rev_8_21_14_2_50_68_7]PIX74242.1 MAG: alkylhydroperoxidase [Rhodocyclales bacterium CG_4_10_14_3_um_filter_68_10]PJA56164.1 MAG: alkylhydroperoxidase [Rhodocyclales bacterium CG_4_9_14_3_um_filter_68_10]HCX33674.1 alkylhydroperoxidase [Rhodocyclaceae bacterium]